MNPAEKFLKYLLAHIQSLVKLAYEYAKTAGFSEHQIAAFFSSVSDEARGLVENELQHLKQAVLLDTSHKPEDAGSGTSRPDVVS